MDLIVCQAKRSGPPGPHHSNAGGGGPGRRPPRQGRGGKSGGSGRGGSGSSRRSKDFDSVSQLAAALEVPRQQQRGHGFTSGGVAAEEATLTVTEAPGASASPVAAALGALASRLAPAEGLLQQAGLVSFGASSGGGGGGSSGEWGAGLALRGNGAADADVPASESDADWDDLMTADLSDAEMAELRGEDPLSLAPVVGAPGEGAPADAAAAAAAAAGVEALLEPILAQFPFILDAFQLQALQRLLLGRSVVVCAPTGETACGFITARLAGRRCGRGSWAVQGRPLALWGLRPLANMIRRVKCRAAKQHRAWLCAGAGKTAIAEAAAIHWLGLGKRVIYTTPLKALSNQKLGELRQRFGASRVRG